MNSSLCESCSADSDGYTTLPSVHYYVSLTRRALVRRSSVPKKSHQVKEFLLICKDKRFVCRVCSKVNFLAIQTRRRLRLANEWSRCLISTFGDDQTKQLSLQNVLKNKEFLSRGEKHQR